MPCCSLVVSRALGGKWVGSAADEGGRGVGEGEGVVDDGFVSTDSGS